VSAAFPACRVSRNSRTQGCRRKVSETLYPVTDLAAVCERPDRIEEWFKCDKILPTTPVGPDTFVVTAFPDWVEPMAATLTHERFTGPEWIFERKYDGIRALAFKHGGDVRLLSRNRLPQHNPAVSAAIAALDADDVILDGELTWRGEERIAYYVFDVLWLDGRDVMRLPLDERRALLRSMNFRAPVQRVEPLDDANPWDRARAEGWEGVIAKRRDSPYEHRRSPHWRKMKCEASQELVVGGFTDPQGGRVGLGALLVGYYQGDDFVFAGKVGTGFDTKLLLELRKRLDALEIAKSPFTQAKGLPRVRAHWVTPDIVVQVAFIEWTVHGKLRHSRLLGVRSDKDAREVVREAP
jgi:bifunctional non-homologous end joining protein LigD